MSAEEIVSHIQNKLGEVPLERPLANTIVENPLILQIQEESGKDKEAGDTVIAELPDMSEIEHAPPSAQTSATKDIPMQVLPTPEAIASQIQTTNSVPVIPPITQTPTELKEAAKKQSSPKKKPRAKKQAPVRHQENLADRRRRLTPQLISSTPSVPSGLPIYSTTAQVQQSPQSLPSAPTTPMPALQPTNFAVISPTFRLNIVRTLGSPSSKDPPRVNTQLLDANHEQISVLPQSNRLDECNTLVRVSSTKFRTWSTVISGCATNVAGNKHVIGISTSRGHLHFLAGSSGRSISPPVILGSVVLFLESNARSHFAVLTCDGLLRVIDTRHMLPLLPRPVSVQSLLSPRASLEKLIISDNGIAAVVLKDGSCFAAQPSLAEWVMLSDRADKQLEQEQAYCSSSFSNISPSVSFLGSISQTAAGVAPVPVPILHNAIAKNSRPVQYLKVVATLQRRIATTELMGTDTEYRQAVCVYIRKLADEGEEPLLRDALSTLR